MYGIRDNGGRGTGDLLVFILHVPVEFGITYLPEHFRVNLSGMTNRSIFIILQFMFLSFRLQ